VKGKHLEEAKAVLQTIVDQLNRSTKLGRKVASHPEYGLGRGTPMLTVDDIEVPFNFYSSRPKRTWIGGDAQYQSKLTAKLGGKIYRPNPKGELGVTTIVRDIDVLVARILNRRAKEKDRRAKEKASQLLKDALAERFPGQAPGLVIRPPGVVEFNIDIPDEKFGTNLLQALKDAGIEWGK
jgi:hypothetical protein